ncbi:hypothetical protein AB8O38_19760 [Saccharomonospora xinjiangensis]|uniref:hypothetical protein n=1 Tax=Saccharomonospora xinjiangensis TaxID=75294 RepID=UPI00350F4781
MDDRLDEARLENLLRDAVGDAPEPSFTVDDVTVASRRLTARRRSLATAAAVGVVLTGAVTGVVIGATGADDTTSTALGPAEVPVSGEVAKKSSEEGQPGDGGLRGQSVEGFPPVSPKQGGGTEGEDGPRAGGTSGCRQVDRELATALAGELPIDPDGEAIPAPHCVAGASSAAFTVRGGTVQALLTRPGVAVQLPPLPPGGVVGEGRTAENATVLVISLPGDGDDEAPFADRADGIADRVAEALSG